MKRIIIVALCFFALKASSQKIDTSIKFCQAAKINVINYTSGILVKTDTLTHIGVFNYTDDLKGSCVANWTLIATNRNVIFDSYTLTIEEYNNWDGSATGLLKVLAAYLKVTCK
jgi:hypothetical protein